MALGRQVRRKESQVRKAVKVKVKWKKHEKKEPFTSPFLRAMVHIACHMQLRYIVESSIKNGQMK
jgi:hypothetical protein